MTQIMLVGNPNCGKTTLFNALTGEHQRVGNWPGVTVEKRIGTFTIGELSISVTDLPGVYSLAIERGASQDAFIAGLAMMSADIDLYINVVDACHLERHLYLTSQLLELNKPVIVALNMLDMAEQRGISIDIQALSQQLGCPVVAIQAHRHVGIDALQDALSDVLASPYLNVKPTLISFPAILQPTLEYLEQQLIAYAISPTSVFYIARRVLEGDVALMSQSCLNLDIMALLKNQSFQPDADVLMADARYQAVHAVVMSVQKKRSDIAEHWTARIDRVVLHRFWALPIFLAVMYCMFLFSINVGGAFQDFFDITTDTIFVRGTAFVLQQLHAPAWLIVVCANGIGKGLNTTLTFIPVIAAMFFFLAFLETSGYMARAAFVVDRIMRSLGLPGKAFVPMIVGFGCNVPAILASRTMDSEHDRLLTVFMTPFMSCSARLAIYAVFVSAFFQRGGQNIVFSLYFIGILVAVLTGFLLRKTLLRGQSSPLILELPAYHRPSPRRLARETVIRLRYFLIRAGKLIVPICVVLEILNAVHIPVKSHLSLLAQLGHWLTPLFAPMGIAADNWPATVGLLTGMLAKEVVVGTLNSLYTQVGHLTSGAVTDIGFWSALKAGVVSIPDNFSHLGHALLNPWVGGTSSATLGKSVYGVMYQQFASKAAAYAYLLFILLYIPCVSTMAAIRQEANRRFMWFAIVWSLFVAYLVAVMFYQLSTFVEHPQQSLLWLCGVVVLACLGYILVQWRGRYVIATP